MIWQWYIVLLPSNKLVSVLEKEKEIIYNRK